MQWMHVTYAWMWVIATSWLTAASAAAQSASCIACDLQECPSYANACSSAECQSVYACLILTGCGLSSAPESCYCGTTPLSVCADTGGDGPCKAAIETATGSSSPSSNLELINSPGQPVAHAFERALCDRDLCQVCSEPPPVNAVPSSGPLGLSALAMLLLIVLSRKLGKSSFPVTWRRRARAPNSWSHS
jgi:hypothetical protein